MSPAGSDSVTGTDGNSITRAELLKLLLSVPRDCPVFATPGFASWLRDDERAVWPPPRSASSGFWLVDTRDPVSREHLDWRTAASRQNCVGGLVLSGEQRPGGVVRRFVRKLRDRLYRDSRLTPDAVEARLAGEGETMSLTRLGFHNGPEVPTEYHVSSSDRFSGQAFLVCRHPPFSGSIWQGIASATGNRDWQLRSFQVRVRGAGIIHLEAEPSDLVVRVIPADQSLGQVRENHTALRRLHDSLGARTKLRNLIPEPVFRREHRGTLLMGETRLPGTLAWKVASGSLESVIHQNAVEFLSRLRDATKLRTPLGRTVAAKIIEHDLRRLEESRLVADPVRSLLKRELERGGEMLTDAGLHPCTSHGDYGYGNLLVDPESGELKGVIDWGTWRELDFPGIDRVNLEIQTRRTLRDESFSEAVSGVWRNRAAHDALDGTGAPEQIRALFGLAVCRSVLRSLDFTDVYRSNADDFRRALHFLDSLGA